MIVVFVIPKGKLPLSAARGRGTPEIVSGLLGPGDERIGTGRYTLCMGLGASWNTAQRQRFPAADIDEVLAEVRVMLRERGAYEDRVGEVGSPRRAGLVDALLERGLHAR